MRKWHIIKSKGIGKPGKLEKHFSSKSHTAALTSFFNYSMATVNVDLMLSKELKLREIQKQKDTIQNREVIKILLMLPGRLLDRI